MILQLIEKIKNHTGNQKGSLGVQQYYHLQAFQRIY